MESYSNLLSIQRDVLSGKIRLKELVLFYLDTIQKNGHLNAFLEVFDEEALLRAEEVDAKMKAGKAGKLAGMVIAIKDNICFKNHHVSASSKILEGFTSIYSSTVVERLLAEDAIIIGRCNCDEFAMGASNETSPYGPVLNAADNTRVSGGSSGGAAVAVQSNMCLASIGSDTGGSIRQPAAFCGLYGLKPTYGRVSRWGLLAYASSFDQIGPITKSIDDMQIIMEVISGKDDFDATVSDKLVPSYTKDFIAEKKYRIAYIKECIEHEGIDEEIKKVTFDKIELLRKEGHIVEEISFPYLDFLVPVYYVLTTAEASSNLSRFSGLSYGYRSKNISDLETTFKRSRSEGFGAEVKRRIMLGTFVLSAGFFDAYYTKGQQVRRLVQEKTNEILSSYDFILSPTTPTPAFKLGEKVSNPVAMYLADIFTVHANISGNPAISIPVGNHSNGMPMGLQLMSANFSEGELLQFAKKI
ncbi:MAG: Asp-tRNA(Asn)/Glu-tRNA(Gln) amidotransferase subunit GatA [Bacteroidota bacterium]